MTTDCGAARRDLFRRQAVRPLAVDLGETLCEALAFRIDQGSGARTGHSVGSTFQWDLARKRRADHAILNGPVVGEAARVRITVALDQPRAFGDLEGELR